MQNSSSKKERFNLIYYQDFACEVLKNHRGIFRACSTSRDTGTRNTGTRNTGTRNTGTPEHHGTFRNTRKTRNTPKKPGTLPRKPGTPQENQKHPQESLEHLRKTEKVQNLKELK